MDTRIAAVSIVVENPAAVDPLNNILHSYSEHIIGRMGIPYREKGVNIICLAVDAPLDIINGLTGKIGRIPGVSAKAAYSNYTGQTKA